MLDKTAAKLQQAGLNRYAEKLDAISNTLEKLSAVQEEKELRIPLEELPPEVEESSKSKVIEQGFISKVDACDVRIRSCEDKYTMTAKFRPLNQEAETEITKEMFDALWPATTDKMKKTRYDYKGWEIDVLEDGRIIAEYEYTKETTVDLPTTWKVKLEKKNTEEKEVPQMRDFPSLPDFMEIEIK